jgi:hypothetical protein
MADPVIQGGAVLTGEISPRRISKKQPHPLNPTHLDQSQCAITRVKDQNHWLGKAQSIPIELSRQAKIKKIVTGL